MTSAEFADWIAYNNLQPIGDERLDLLIAQLSAVVANFRPGRTRRDRSYTIRDFLPTWGRAAPPTSGDLYIKIRAAMTAAAPGGPDGQRNR